METSNLLDIEFKTLVTNTLNKLKSFNSKKKKKKKTIKTNQAEMKDTLTEMQNNL